MGPYSHAVLAARFIDRLHPDDFADYLWGAVAPDVRYLARMPRKHTHLPLETIAGWEGEHPDLKSFILGYRVHCLIDQIDVAMVVRHTFPFNLITRVKKIPNQQMTMLAELHFIETNRGNGSLPPISGKHNAILRGLGIPEECSAAMADGMRPYLAHPGFDDAMAAFSRIGMVDNTRIKRYARAAESLKKHPALTRFLLWGMKNAHLERAADGIISGGGSIGIST